MDGHFTPECGTQDAMDCDICGENMDIQRDVNGPTGLAEAMGKMRHMHDVFSCPFRETEWHKQAASLIAAAHKTPSKQLEVMLLDEMKEIVASKQSTKEVSNWSC